MPAKKRQNLFLFLSNGVFYYFSWNFSSPICKRQKSYTVKVLFASNVSKLYRHRYCVFCLLVGFCVWQDTPFRYLHQYLYGKFINISRFFSWVHVKQSSDNLLGYKGLCCGELERNGILCIVKNSQLSDSHSPAKSGTRLNSLAAVKFFLQKDLLYI